LSEISEIEAIKLILEENYSHEELEVQIRATLSQSTNSIDQKFLDIFMSKVVNTQDLRCCSRREEIPGNVESQII
jgi:hypothetical protein